MTPAGRMLGMTLIYCLIIAAFVAGCFVGVHHANHGVCTTQVTQDDVSWRDSTGRSHDYLPRCP